MEPTYGRFPLKLDEKYRLIIPARARPDLAGGVYLAQGPYHCVFMFSAEQFGAFRKRLRKTTVPGIRGNDLDRVFHASLVTVDMDRQGRITIPPGLRGWAHLEHDVVVVGNWSGLEIWDAGIWAEYNDQYSEIYSTAISEVR
ncbi:MAG: hypothetical protein LBJ62_11305 [Bifidobacteriaceae bacterium]|jgi:MraZ protein|nr:hypothetical protein [Bifidobacteriaceae bacterium]